MGESRFLVIIYDRYLLQFILLSSDGSDVKMLHEHQLRIYRAGLNFSVADYILQALAIWGKEIGIRLVKEGVPIIPETENAGISDIILLTSEDDSGLDAVSKHIYMVEDDVKKEGAMNVTNFVDFNNILFVSFDNNDTSIVRYEKNRKGAVKVVAEKKVFNIKKVLNNRRFIDYISQFSSLISLTKALNILQNWVKIPEVNVDDFDSVLVEFLLAIYRLEAFVSCKKLRFSSFGNGEVKDSKLIISGENFRTGRNVELSILAIMSVFNLKGFFSLYTDKYGLFDYLQRQKKQLFDDSLYKKLLYKYWGTAFTVRSQKKAEVDEVVADIDVKDGSSPRQIIPMFERITRFEFFEKGSMKLEMRKGFSFYNKKNRLDLKNLKKNIIIDSRSRPVDYRFIQSRDFEKVKEWLKGVESFI